MVLADFPIFDKGDVVQFNADHKWQYCYGVIDEVKDLGGDYRYLIAVRVPMEGIAYIFSLESDREFEFVGKSVFAPDEDDDYGKKEE